MDKLESDLAGARFAAQCHLDNVIELTRIRGDLVIALQSLKKRCTGDEVQLIINNALRAAGAL